MPEVKRNIEGQHPKLFLIAEAVKLGIGHAIARVPANNPYAVGTDWHEAYNLAHAQGRDVTEAWKGIMSNFLGGVEVSDLIERGVIARP